MASRHNGGATPPLPLPWAGLLALCAGGLSVLAFSPFDFYLLLPFTLALLFYLWLGASPRRAFALGWLFGAGFMGLGVFWIRIQTRDACCPSCPSWVLRHLRAC